MYKYPQDACFIFQIVFKIVINYTIGLRSKINVNIKVKCHDVGRVDHLGLVPKVGHVRAIAHAQYYNLCLPRNIHELTPLRMRTITRFHLSYTLCFVITVD